MIAKMATSLGVPERLSQTGVLEAGDQGKS